MAHGESMQIPEAVVNTVYHHVVGNWEMGGNDSGTEIIWLAEQKLNSKEVKY